MKYFIHISFILFGFHLTAQETLKGSVMSDNEAVPFAKIKIKGVSNALSDIDGKFIIEHDKEGTFEIEVFAQGYELYKDTIILPFRQALVINLNSLSPLEVDEVVVSGTLRAVTKKASVVNIEVLSEKFLQKNPSSSIFDALQNVNGVRPQLNCNICNTGDIHINGLEGPYTMVLIDGMPIVSSLSTVYGLFGIPNSIIERVEIIKGPASTLYGSEAIGGIINIITKNSGIAPRIAVDVRTSSWLETNVDLAIKNKLGQKTHVLTGLNAFNYDYIKDVNDDRFTDVTLQERYSIFQKWNFDRKDYRVFSIAGRVLYEDRWGGETNWSKQFRGTDSIYGESIYTKRWELIGKYQLPLKEDIFFSTSVNNHVQDSYYGDVAFMANQFTAFGQLHWQKEVGKHNLLLGSAYRYMKYDDNTTATESGDSIPINAPVTTNLPGFFAQDEITINKKNKLLGGLRYDHNSLHGSIFTPRIGYKLDIKHHSSIRLNTGTGYRVVNIYTEDHAALTGARDVIILDGIKPEQSYNANLNYTFSRVTKKEKLINLDLTFFYTYFTNKIIADYDTDPDLIIYDNIDSYAVDQGITLNLQLVNLFKNLDVIAGCTFMDVASFDNGIKTPQILTENFSGSWSVSYKFKNKISLDYTGNVYSPMRLPVLNELDPRSDYSPWWSIQNIQISYKGLSKWEFYGGVKNLLNWTPAKSTSFLIARAHDPFDKNVSYDGEGNVLQTGENPYALTFDPSYVYAPNQGARAYLGVRFILE